MLSVSVEPEFAPLVEEWEELVDRTGAVPFMRPQWIEIWWRAFGAGSPTILTARERGRLVGLVPLVRPAWRAPSFKAEPFPPTARPSTLRSVANWHSPKFGFLTESDQATRILAEALFSEKPALLSLAFFDPDFTAFDASVAAARAAGYEIYVQSLPPSPYVLISGGWEEYTSRLSGKFLRDLRRRHRKLAELGEVIFEVHDGHRSLETLLADGFETESSGWKHSHGSSIASRSETLRFYTDVARWASERGWLRLAFLRLNGETVAFQFGMESNDVYFFLKGGYNPAYRLYAPGKQLVRHMLERAFVLDLSRFDFLGGSESWKLEWTDTWQEQIILHAFAPSLQGKLESAAITVAPPSRKWVRNQLRPLRPLAKRVTRGWEPSR